MIAKPRMRSARRRLLRSFASAALLPAAALADSRPEPRTLKIRPLPADERMAQIHSDGAWLWAVSHAATLWQHTGDRWRRIAEGISPATPPASGHGFVAARTVEGALWTLSNGTRRSSVDGVQLLPHARLLVTRSAIFGVARGQSGEPRLLRLEAELDRWEPAAVAPPVMQPDTRPIAYSLDPQQGSEAEPDVVVFGRGEPGRAGGAETARLLSLDYRTLRVLRSLAPSPPHSLADMTPRPLVWRGRPSLLTVRVGPNGARLAVIAAAPGAPQGLEVIALGAPLGEGRSLLPITDGRQLLAVHAPHVEGALHLYEPDPAELGALRSRLLLLGVNMQPTGARELDAAAWSGPRLVLPSQDRRQLLVLDSDADFVARSAIMLSADAAAVHAHRDGVVVLDTEGRVGWAQLP